MSEPVGELGTLAMRGVFWSVLQNWGGRILTLLLFVILTRLLSPTDYGVAAAALLVTLLLATISEFGFGDAVIQRRELTPEDVNLPFYASIGASGALALAAFFAAPRIEIWLGAPGLAPVVQALAVSVPILTASAFQEMQYRRHLAFRTLAVRVLLSTIVAGVISIALALTGAGVWALVAQSVIASLVGATWLWSRPRWLPSKVLRPGSFVELAKFALPVVSLRVMDFAATRFVDVLLLWRYGIVSFAVYSVAARLYQIMLQLFQTVLNDVSLPLLSKIALDIDRIRAIYLQTVSLSAYLVSPIFVLIAALAPEVCLVLFGDEWVGVDKLAVPLILLGAVQCVQHLNGPYLSARGRPNKVLITATAKYLILLAGIWVLPSGSSQQLVIIFALLQLVVTPLSFAMVADELKVSWFQLLGILVPAAAACALAFGGVYLTRPFVHAVLPAPLFAGVALGVVFSIFYLSFVMVFVRKTFVSLVSKLSDRLTNRSSLNAA
jgi:O-antigen/teichoic acid export membrane protein